MVELKEKRREYTELRTRERRGEELTEEESKRMVGLQEELTKRRKGENLAELVK